MRSSSSHRGAVYVEFLVAFMPVLIFFLGLLQLALSFSAQLVVRHAATRAVRAAIVVLDDDPARYDDDPRGQVVYEGASGQDSQSQLGDIASKLDIPGDPSSSMDFGGSEGNARLNAIRRAAYMPLAALAPPLGQLSRAFGLGDGSSAAELGNGGRFLAGLLLYNRGAAMVTLRGADGAVVQQIDADGDVTIHVSYLYFCGIPFASLFMCDSVSDLTGLTRARDAVSGVVENVRSGDIQGAIRAGRELRQELRDARAQFDELRAELSYAETPELLLPFIFTNAHFRMLRAQATLPNQGACYYSGSSCYAGAAAQGEAQ